MSCSKTANNKIDKLYEQALRLVYDDYETATLLKVILLHGHFSRFLNCANGTKCNLRSRSDFRVPGINTVFYGANSFRYFGSVT